MLFKDSITLLAEAAEFEINNSAETAINESVVMSTYDNIEELSEEVQYPAEFVPVVKIRDEFFTEMQYLAPFMQNNGIASVEEALDTISVANGFEPKTVGLLVESQECVTDKINEALKKGGAKGKRNFLAKLGKGEKLTGKLKKDGYKVKKKKSSRKKKSYKGKVTEGKKCCPECGLPLNECKCGKGSVKESKKVCPECGKYPCECAGVKEAALFGFNVDFR